MKNAFLLITFALFSVFLFGCLGGSPQDNGNGTAGVQDNDSIEVFPPSFQISSPANNAQFTTEPGLNSIDVQIKLETTDIVINPRMDVNRYGEGHFHITVDGSDQLMVFKKEHTLSLSKGTHTIVVEFVNNDHTPYSPEIKKSITVVVNDGGPIVPEYETHEVSITQNGYEPREITIGVGDSVVWTNSRQFDRSVSCLGKFDSGRIAEGQTFSYTFENEGVYSYTSRFNIGGHVLAGTVTVVGD